GVARHARDGLGQPAPEQAAQRVHAAPDAPLRDDGQDDRPGGDGEGARVRLRGRGQALQALEATLPLGPGPERDD
ncbi:MAG TPA: hypothetical protein DHV14_00190, partial [Micrococcales bacterium]|nr:hypothetical protein [Micrococcales bacterium]